MPTIKIRKITTTVSRILQRQKERAGRGGGKTGEREHQLMRSKCTKQILFVGVADSSPFSF